MPQDLFAHLALQFSSSPENLATEGLSFILNASATARQAFSNLLAQVGVSLPAELKFATQSHSAKDTAIPDLLGITPNGQELLLGEAKFWAGLTQNQPVTYLQRLIQSNGRLLLFLAPAMRFPTLWPELQRRCAIGGLALQSLPSGSSEIEIARFGEQDQYLVLMSWRVLLDTLQQALLTQGDLDMAGNVAQLQSLCERMDTTAFLPLTAEELNNQVGRRYMQFCDLLDEVTNILVSSKYASRKGYKATGTRPGYIRYLHMQNHAVSFEVNMDLWSNCRATPIWLGIMSKDWRYDPRARESLVSLETETPPRLFRGDKIFYVPIFLGPGLEKDALVQSIIRQIKEIFALLKEE